MSKLYFVQTHYELREDELSKWRTSGYNKKPYIFGSLNKARVFAFNVACTFKGEEECISFDDFEKGTFEDEELRFIVRCHHPLLNVRTILEVHEYELGQVCIESELWFNVDKVLEEMNK